MLILFLFGASFICTMTVVGLIVYDDATNFRHKAILWVALIFWCLSIWALITGLVVAQLEGK